MVSLCCFLELGTLFAAKYSFNTRKPIPTYMTEKFYEYSVDQNLIIIRGLRLTRKYSKQTNKFDVKGKTEPVKYYIEEYTV